MQDCNGIKITLRLAISSMSGIAMETIENSIEPYMVRMGFVVRTQKGRLLATKTL